MINILGQRIQNYSLKKPTRSHNNKYKFVTKDYFIKYTIFFISEEAEYFPFKYLPKIDMLAVSSFFKPNRTVWLH